MRERMTVSEETSQTQQGDPSRVPREVAGRRILFDGEGFLWDPKEWSEDVAEALARESGLDALSETHWRVIRFLRDYFFHHGRAPLNVQLKEGTGMSLMKLEALFPGGIKRGARRIAGLPNPRSCTG
jgi:dissimilatory sulfite reductase related protein